MEPFDEFLERFDFESFDDFQKKNPINSYNDDSIEIKNDVKKREPKYSKEEIDKLISDIDKKIEELDNKESKNSNDTID